MLGYRRDELMVQDSHQRVERSIYSRPTRMADASFTRLASTLISVTYSSAPLALGPDTRGEAVVFRYVVRQWHGTTSSV